MQGITLRLQPLQHSRQFYGTSRCLASQPRAARPAAPRLVVQANELNKWADRSNYDSHDDQTWASQTFDRETANVMVRVLTSKATQRLLHQLSELNLHVCQWLHNYCSTHPPSEGDKFLLALFKEPSTVVNDAATSTQHTIDPANLAHRIIQIRSDMAKTLTDFPKYMELQNTEVLRNHLLSSTYMSGTSEKGYKERRGYFRPRGPSPGR